jgi:hypothetical protein
VQQSASGTATGYRAKQEVAVPARAWVVTWPRLRWALALPVVAVLLVLAPSPAIASCATDRPPRSPAAFAGLVVAVRSEGRVATVRTDAGTEVQVRGTPGDGLSQGTSVDRTYERGGRYEFHPVNASSPYEDNSCTATRLLSMESLPPVPADSGPGPTGSGLAPTTVVLLALSFALVAAVVAGGLLRRRRRRSRLRDG